jgi:hypothetical protein
MMQKVRSLDVESVSFRLYANRPVKACFHQLAFRAREFESVFLHSRAGSSRFPDQITRADEDV